MHKFLRAVTVLGMSLQAHVIIAGDIAPFVHDLLSNDAKVRESAIGQLRDTAAKSPETLKSNLRELAGVLFKSQDNLLRYRILGVIIGEATRDKGGKEFRNCLLDILEDGDLFFAQHASVGFEKIGASAVEEINERLKQSKKKDSAIRLSEVLAACDPDAKYASTIAAVMNRFKLTHPEAMGIAFATLHVDRKNATAIKALQVLFDDASEDARDPELQLRVAKRLLASDAGTPKSEAIVVDWLNDRSDPFTYVSFLAATFEAESAPRNVTSIVETLFLKRIKQLERDAANISFFEAVFLLRNNIQREAAFKIIRARASEARDELITKNLSLHRAVVYGLVCSADDPKLRRKLIESLIGDERIAVRTKRYVARLAAKGV